MDYDHPVALTSEDDLVRSRLTVFFRLLLAIPHFIWIAIWSVGVFLVAIVNWFATLISGRPPLWCHNFLTAFVRYSAHLTAYVSLTANPFPDFTGRPGSYPVDMHLPAEPQTQNRWKTGFRLILAIPALFVEGGLAGGGGGRGNGYSFSAGSMWINAFLGWWAALFTGRMPEGLRDLNLYALRYAGQTSAYALLVTEQYPDADPFAPPVPASAPPHPVRLDADDDLRRSRLTVFFRLLLAIPHYVWFTLWAIAAAVAGFIGWFAALFTGRLPAPLHRFIAAFLQYGTHLGAFVYLTANPFPGFVGSLGSYPVDLRIEPPAAQNRWKTGFRLILAVPALMVAGGLGTLMAASAFLGWFAALFTGRMPRGLRQAQVFGLRYTGQTYAYLALLTDRYPFASPAPPAAAAVQPVAFEPA
jgi:hypothetical protein